mmetsp:Transcript_100784/g.285700  ORF Transcript_100784/g.285700 Transcript_100784/m.285700 type:complete len:586 (-) Transcript_100784:132-1889(-)
MATEPPIFGRAIRLGYLESALNSAPPQALLPPSGHAEGGDATPKQAHTLRPPARPEEPSSAPAPCNTSKFSDDRSCKFKPSPSSLRLIEEDAVAAGTGELPKSEEGGAAEGEAPAIRLDWTMSPKKEGKTEGHMRCDITTPANAGLRQHRAHLDRTVQIKPETPTRRPPIPGRAREHITVRETDFRRHGDDLRTLRELGVRSPPAGTAAQNQRLDLSFKSAFVQKCRSSSADTRDPWKGLANPEIHRDHNEQDQIMNQVWLNTLEPRRIEADPDEGRQRPRPFPSPLQRVRGNLPRMRSADTLNPNRGVRLSPAAAQGSETARSSSVDPGAMSPWSPSTSWFPGRRARSSRSMARPSSLPAFQPAGGASARDRSGSRGRQMPDDDGAGQAPKKSAKVVENRIQVVESPPGGEEDEENRPKGSHRVQSAIKNECRWLRRLEEQPRIVWLALDQETGELQAYPKAVAARIESAYCNRRASVPLNGLGIEHLEDSIVRFGGGPSSEGTFQIGLRAGKQDVRRVEVSSEVSEVSMNVTREEVWRFADDAAPGSAEVRYAPVAGAGVLSQQQNSVQQQINRSQRQCRTVE